MEIVGTTLRSAQSASPRAPARAGCARRRALSVLMSTRIAAAAGSLLLALAAPPAHAQFKVQESFTQATAPGWSITNNAILTGGAIDPAGSGWLRLTPALGNQKGEALYTSSNFAGAQSLVVKFSYVAWGGNGADGITVFLYDATQDMTGAKNGGGLGYCAGAGGYLAIGLDEYGNFSNPADKCGAASGGPGAQPDRLVIRGPLSANNAFVANSPVAGGIDFPGAASRPPADTVLVVLSPAGAGFNVSVKFQSGPGATYQTLVSNASFPYVPPALLSVGFSGSTGGSTNTHEVQNLSVASPADIQVALAAPAFVAQGSTLTYTIGVTSNGPIAIDSANAPTLVDAFPAGVTGVTWTCSGAGGATCAASGSGNLNTSQLALPVGGIATYTVTGTASASAACGSTLSNSANADFGPSTGFTDTTPDNNSASASTFVVCIAPQADSGTAAAGTASTPIANVAANDNVNGQVATLGASGNATIAASGAYPTGIALDVASGAISTTTGAVPGVHAVQYQLCDKLTPAHCATATATVTVNAVIAPQADSGTAAAGTAGTPVANVAANDSVNGQAATLGAAGNATVAPSGAYPAGVTLNTTTGAIASAASTAPGAYAIQYQLCDRNSPANCATATANITVNAVIAPQPDAGTVSAGTAASAVANVAGNDSVNGQPATLGAAGNATLATVGSYPAGISLNLASGALDVAATVAPGTYTVQYQVCDRNSPVNCATASITVTVTAAILPQPDSGAGQSGTAGTPIAGITTNDTVNGFPASLGAGGNATVAPVGAYPGGLTLNPASGAIAMTAAVQPGVYALQYQLCDKNAPVNCANATATVSVSAVILAQPYSGTVTAGTAATVVASVAVTDSVNGQASTLGAGGNSTIAAVGSYPAGISLNTTTGAVTTTANVAPGIYTLQYQLCDRNSPPNCATSTVTATVAGSIVPQPDAGTGFSGAASTAVANVAANDVVNGHAATLGPAGNATVAASGPYPAGVSLAAATGSISMTASVAPGTYVVQYQLCDKSVPANCANSTATVTVNAVITPQPDSGTTNSGTASAAIANVAANDVLNGQPAVLGAGGNATVAASGAYPAGIALNTTSGAITVAASVGPGVYAVQYRLCDLRLPPECATATTTVTVKAVIIAQPDAGSAPAGSASTAIANISANDSINGQPALLGVAGNATVAPVASYPAGVALDAATGAITVSAAVPAAIYPLQYQLCDKSVPSNCATTTATVTITPPAKVSVAKSAGVPKQLTPTAFEVPYLVLVGNNGPPGLIAYNLEANDDLAIAFPGATAAVKAGSVLVLARGGATCTANAAFNGSADTRLLSGADSLGAGASCAVRFTAVVTYPTVASIPRTSQSNFAYASATPLGAGPNPGFGFAGGAPTPPANALSTAVSVSGVAPPSGSAPGTPPVVPSLPPGGNQNGAPTPVTLTIVAASISGSVWDDSVGASAGNGQRTAGKPGLAGWTAELIDPSTGRVATLLDGSPATSTTDSTGAYRIANAIPGNYLVEFVAPGSTVVWGTPVNGETADPQPNSALDPATRALAVTLLPGAPLIQQSLPVDPSGVVYDSAARTPLSGAAVTLLGPNGTPVAASGLLPGQQGQVTSATGAYRFDLQPSAAAGVYTIQVAAPSSYLFPSIALPPQAGALPLQPGPLPYAVATAIPPPGQPARYYLALNLAPATNPAAVVGNDIPLDSTSGGVLLIDKASDRTQVEVGDSLRYRIRVRNSGTGVILAATAEDTLPLGFAQIPGTVLIGRDGSIPTKAADPQGTPGPRLGFTLV